MLTKFKVELPVANSLRYTVEGSSDDERANFDQRRYANVENATNDKRQYLQLYEKADIVPQQFFTNYPAMLAEVVDCDDNVLHEYEPTLVVAYRNKKFRTSCQFISMDGKLFIYFNTEVEYTDEDFLVPGDTTDYDGSLPAISAVAGDIIRYKIGALDFEASLIDEIVWNPDVQAEGYLLDVDATIISSVVGLVEVSYNEKDVNLFSVPLAFNAFVQNNLVVFLRLSFGLSDAALTSKVFISEPIYLKTKHQETLLLKYRHAGDFTDSDRWGYVYGEGEYGTIRFPANFYQMAVAGELDTNINDTGVAEILRAVPYRQILFRIMNVPGWVIDKLLVIFSHDTKVINEYEWEIENFGSLENVDRVDLPTLEINLRQKNDRTKFVVESDIDVSAAFAPTSDTAVFGGEVLSFVFSANVPGVFSFLALPAWLTPNVASFQDGDTVELTVAANATLFDREANLIATSPDYSGLTATLDIVQAHDESAPEFIGVDVNPVTLAGAAASNQLLNVNSSGDYDITYGGAHAFTAAKETGFTQVRISEATQNSGSTSRTGTVTLTLQSNPAIFVVINVSQIAFDEIFSVTPASDIIDAAGGEKHLVVSTGVAAQWQATSPQSGPPAVDLNDWLHFDKTIQVGSAADFVVNVDSKPPYIPPRVGTITFYSIANPADAVVYTITQND